MSIREDGRHGEERTRLFLLDTGATNLSQPDWIAFWRDEWCIFESKHQDEFVGPPFDGHGLPPKQVAARLELQRLFGMRAVLVVHEKTIPVTYWQYLDVLEAGLKDYTKTRSRVLYPISAFNIVARPELPVELNP